MKIPRPRFTVRRLMVAVAVAALALGLGLWMTRRNAAFRRESDRHFWACMDCLSRSWAGRAVYHREMSARYRWAADYPWFQAAPGPVVGCCCEPGARPLAAVTVGSCCERGGGSGPPVATCCPTMNSGG